MPKITEYRMREILEAEYHKSGNMLFSQVVDSFMSHPEIKSLFEKKEVNRVDRLNELILDTRIMMERCGKLEDTQGVAQYTCVLYDLKQELKELNESTEATKENEDAPYEVIEYVVKSCFNPELEITKCEKDSVICVGGKFCTELCSKFICHEIEGKSIRCAYKHNGGE